MATVVYGGVTVTYGGVTVVYGGADAGGETPPAAVTGGGGGFPRNQTTLPYRIRRLSELDEKRDEAPEAEDAPPPLPGVLEKAAEPVFGPPRPPIAPEALKAAQDAINATQRAIDEASRRLADDEETLLLLMR